jgi:hypothetical protein
MVSACNIFENAATSVAGKYLCLQGCGTCLRQQAMAGAHAL